MRRFTASMRSERLKQTGRWRGAWDGRWPFRSRTCGGFSLVELLVVIAVIVAFAAIAANLLLIGSGAESQTRIILSAAMGIAEEYASQTNSAISQTVPVTPDDPIERFVRAARQMPAGEKLLNSLGEDSIQDTDGDGEDEIVDGWGRPLKYLENNAPSDALYDAQFMIHRGPYLASAGRDGQWGDISKADGDPLKTQTKDNLYSFDVD